MGFAPTSSLSSNPTTHLRDWQHAADLFNADQFRLAPKSKFLFHVAFGINTQALANANIVQRYGQEINMLVKAVDLPNYTVQTEMLNQYNRKKVVQYQHKPGEISMKFHDDNMGLINQVWQNYYSYYYADSRTAKQTGAYNRNAMQSSNYIVGNYGFDNGSTVPFFKYIKIYQMARHEYVMYQLHNPIISSWNHNRVDYSQTTQPHDFDMKIQYEAVSYDVGQVTADAPEGFGVTHYDNHISPLDPPTPVSGPSFATALDIEKHAPAFISNALNQINSAQNTQMPVNTNGTSGLLTVSNGQTPGGLSGVTFPISKAGSTTSSIASITNLTGF